jgi:nucleotide-binding universal stress UspA family protein
MVHVDPASPSDGRVRLAAGLANQFDATLIGIAAKAVPPIVLEGLVVEAQLADEEYEDLRGTLAREEGTFRKSAEGAKALEWRSAVDLPTEFVAREARAADLIIIGREQASSNLYESLDPAGLILRAGRPVLTVPQGVATLDTTSVLVAWKNTREARRAVREALPLLQKAGRVLVAEVIESGDGESVRKGLLDVAAYLARHRVKASAQAIPQGEGSAPDALIRFFADNHVGLIVAGAYGHSRLGEWIFGGVTRGLLKGSSVPCLWSH